ncbi:MAG: type I methionyl aminopeptidase [Patescibacteria group bacterium]
MACRSFLVYNFWVVIKNDRELYILREGGKKLAEILESIKAGATPGVAAKELDRIAEEEILKAGGKPSFKGYRPPGVLNKYPATLCVSINDAVVHGIPGEQVLKDGDLVGIDIGMEYGGFYTDMAVSIGIGKITEREKKLLDVGERALEIGIGQVRGGVNVGDIGSAIQKFVGKNNFGVVRELVGHGVGLAVHENPEIPNWGKLGSGPVLKVGEVIAIEPMITAGHYAIKLLPDGWTWATRDGSKAVHFEHTLVVTKNGAEVLTRL